MKSATRLISSASLALAGLTALLYAGPTLGAVGEAPSTAEVLTKIHATNQKEIRMGKAAEKKGSSKEVTSFGKMLVKDHTDADKKVMALAKKEKIELGTPPMAGNDEEMSGMAKGSEWDVHFGQAMANAHAEAIAELTTARDRTTDDKLKGLLDELLPVLKKHEETAQKIVEKSKR